MKIIALLLAVSVFGFASACTSIPKPEPVVCTPASPDKSEESERDGLDRDYIACVITRDAMRPARTCYEQTFTEPGYRADPIRTMTKFQIDTDGHVKRSETTADRGSDSLPKCVNAAIKALNFAKPFGGVPVKVSYPFMFKRLGNAGTESIFDN